MKRILFFLIGIMSTATLLADVVENYEYEGLTFSYDTDTHKATLTNGKSISSSNLSIPVTIMDGDLSYSVTAIESNAFRGNTNIVEVTIPEGVETIGTSAFQGCSQIKMITLPSTLNTIGNSAFQDCSRLVYIGWGQTDPTKFNPTSIFKNKQMTLYVPDATVYSADENWKNKFGDRIYEGNMKKVIHDGMIYVCAAVSGEATLYAGKNNEDIVIPETFTEDDATYRVTGVGLEAFKEFSEIVSLNIEGNVTDIFPDAFRKCSNLRKLVLPASLRNIGNNAFYECSTLAHVCCKVAKPSDLNPGNLPSNDMMTLYVPDVYTYGEDANWSSKFKERIFQGEMTELRYDNMYYICATGTHEATLYRGKDEPDVEIPYQFAVDGKAYFVKGIDRRAFYNCQQLINLIVPESVFSIGPEAFKNCKFLETVKLPSVLKYIYSQAFNDCNLLARVVCPISVPFAINDNVFTSTRILYVPYGKSGLYKETGGWKKFVYIMEGEAKEVVYDNMNYICSTDSKEAILIQGDKNATEKTIPVTIYDEYNYPYVVELIDNSAFKNASNLVKLTIESPTSGSPKIDIGKEAFSNCSKLRMLTLPSHLNQIGSNAFANCGSLDHIVCKSSNPPTIESNVFSTKSKSTLYIPTGSLSTYNGTNDWSFTNIVPCDEMEELGDGGFTYICLTNGESYTATLTKGASSVSDVVIPSSVTSARRTYDVIAIDKSAFSGFKSLVNLTLSEGISIIGANAFQYCTDLKKLILPSSITTIGDLAFNGCSNLADIESKINNPFPISSTVFSNTAASLYVPAGKTEKYRGTEGWKSFTNIFEGSREEVSIDNLTYVYASEGETATLIKSETTIANVVIPQFVPNTTKKVTAIDKYAFSNNTSLENLTIPEGVETIGEYAFQKCSNLKTVILPSTLTSIGDYAFDQCKKIETLTSGIPAAKLFVINDNVFSSDIWPKAAIYVPIGDAATYKAKEGWKKFTNYYEGEKSQITINKMTYEYLTGAKTATLIGTTIEDDNDITIPGTFKIGEDVYTVTAIANSVFKGKTSLVNLTISENIKTIGTYAFQGCSSLKKIEFPSTLRGIGEKAFDGCKNVTHICSLVKVPFEFLLNVFSSYTASLYVPEGTKNSYKSTNYWSQFSNMVEGYLVKEIISDDLTFDLMTTGSEETLKETATLTKSATTTSTVSIPSTIDRYKVTTIGPSSFSGNSKLVNLTIPASVQTIGDNAFNGCNNIENIISMIENPSDISDNVFSTSSASLYVPKGTRDLYKSKNGWSRFTTIYEGERGEKTVGDLSFVYATADKTALLVSTTTTAADVVVPDSFAVNDVYYYVTAIDKSVFKGKTSIVNLTLPSKLTQIGDDAFNGCKNISTITCKAIEPPVITENVFPAYTATLYVPEGSRSKYQKATGWKNFANVFEGLWKEVTLEDGMTFVYVTGDKTATLTKTTSSENDVTIRGSFVLDGVTYHVTAIDNSVFKGNTSVVNLTISENIKSIGAYAFQGCTSLKRLELPSTLISIGEKAFDGDKKLVHVCSKIKSPLDINENVFSNNTAALYVPDGTLSSYQSKSGWNLFANFYEGYFVDELLSDGMSFICMKNGEGKKVTTNAILTKASISSSNVSIPASLAVDGVSYKVTTIGKSAFNNSSKLVNLTLSENIKTIEDNAFANCLNISVVTSMIKEPFDINDNVFSAYTASLYVPVSTRSKYQEAKGWKNFATILEGERNETTTEDGMTYIYATGDKTATLVKATTVDKDFTVRGSFKIGKVTYTVTAIDKSVFKDKKAIVNLKIEENIKSIGANAFQNCVNLEKVELPSTVTEIGEYAFDNCTRLSHIVSKVKSPFPINEDVFAASIYQTAKLYVPTVTSADYKTTAGWEMFKNILVGDMKEVTQDDMTYYCVQGQNIATLVKASTSAAEVTIPATVIDGEITYHVTDIGAYAFSGIGSLKNLTISEGIKSIGTGSFQNCNNLDKIVLPASLTSIDEFAFDKCNRLTLVRNDAKTPIVISDNVFSVYTGKLNVPIGSGDLYRNADVWKLFSTILEGDMQEAEVDGMKYAYVTGPRTATLIKGATEATDLTIPSTVTIDGTEYTVTDIGESAFANVTSIVNLTISGGIKTIGANAFRNCSYLTKVELPSSLTSIGSGAFSKCDRLSHVVSFIMEPFQISDDVFTTMAYTNATLYVPAKTSDLYQNALGWNNFLSVLEGEIYEVTVDGMTYIYVPNLKIAKLTKGVSGVKDVTIPSSISIDGIDYQVTDIDRSAFHGINSLENLIISEGVKTIGYTAFKNCYNLKTVSLPSSLISIGEYAFENCKKIASINCYGKKPVAISENVFSSSSMVLYVPVGSASLYQADNCWGQFDVMEANPITIGKSGKASYCGDKSLDFSYSEEVKAYIATGFDKDEGIIWLTRVKDVPAGVPVLIKGVAGKVYNVPVTDSQNSYYMNMFVGNTTGAEIQLQETSADGSKVNYYLKNGTFLSVSGNATIDNNKCYLQLPATFNASVTGASQTVTVGQTGKASFAAPVDLDFTNVEGLKAFTATGYDKSTKTIWLTRVLKVQQGEGVLLKGDPDDYEIPSFAVQSHYENMFVGNTSGATIEIPETSDDGSQTNFYLKSGTFLSVTGNAKIGNNKCYLALPTSMVAAGASTRSAEENYKFEEPEMIKLPINFRSLENDGDGTTGIKVQSSMFNAPSDAYYTLQGQRVVNPSKGLYIKNGKKVVIK